MAAEETEYAENGKSDLTLVSGSEEFYVHQDVVCSQSPILKEQCATLKVSVTIPAHTRS
jgi:hypothetical protein